MRTINAREASTINYQTNYNKKNGKDLVLAKRVRIYEFTRIYAQSCSVVRGDKKGQRRVNDATAFCAAIIILRT